MNAVNAIYKAPIIHKRVPKNNWGATYVSIMYNSKTYIGKAFSSHTEKDMFSERVGIKIALSRARQSALKDAYKQAQNIANIKTQLYREVLEFGSGSPEEVDPTEKFWRNTNRAICKAKNLQIALKEEEEALDRYLKQLSDFSKAIRKNRAKQNKKT